jgi:hypothetical protein
MRNKLVLASNLLVAEILRLCVRARLYSLRKNSLNIEEIIPQRLKPDLFANTCVRAEARTLQKPEFFRTLFSRAVNR